MTHQLELRAAQMRLQNAAYLYRRAASSPINKRAAVAAFDRQVNADRRMLDGRLPQDLPKIASHLRPIQGDLFGAIEC